MMKRSVITLSSLIVTYTLLGSVVFTGVSLSSKLLGRWRVVKVFEADISRVFPPMTIDLDRSGRVTGRSHCGVFIGSWSSVNNQVRFQGMVPSGCNCGEFRNVERRFIQAMGSTQGTRMEKEGLILMDHGKPVALLVPQRT